MFGVKLPVNQQAFRCPANARAAGFGVQHHAAGFFQICIAVGVDVADAFKMGKHRHPRFALDKAHQPLATARHDHIDIINSAQHFRHHRSV